MLNVNPEIVCSIAQKAREFFGKEDVSIPEDEPNEYPRDTDDDWYYEVLGDYKNDLTFTEIKLAINDLEPDQQATLVALFWVGRGDFDAGEWDNACLEAQRVWNKRTAEYLLTKPLLADFLEDGLNQLGYSCEEY